MNRKNCSLFSRRCEKRLCDWIGKSLFDKVKRPLKEERRILRNGLMGPLYLKRDLE
jgi:hypothetical protein